MSSSSRTSAARQHIAVPANLRAFLQEVHELIETEDESATTVSEDRLRCEYAYGGLVREGGEFYAFTYFTGEGRHCWHLEFDRAEIEAIADGELDHLEMILCRVHDCHCRCYSGRASCFLCEQQRF